MPRIIDVPKKCRAAARLSAHLSFRGVILTKVNPQFSFSIFHLISEFFLPQDESLTPGEHPHRYFHLSPTAHLHHAWEGGTSSLRDQNYPLMGVNSKLCFLHSVAFDFQRSCYLSERLSPTTQNFWLFTFLFPLWSLTVYVEVQEPNVKKFCSLHPCCGSACGSEYILATPRKIFI